MLLTAAQPLKVLPLPPKVPSFEDVPEANRSLRRAAVKRHLLPAPRATLRLVQLLWRRPAHIFSFVISL